MTRLSVNGKTHEIDADPDLPLLWALRDFLGLKGAKYACGIGQCGACTVLVDGAAVRACVTPLAAVGGAPVTTIEGLGIEGGGGNALHPLQRAWIEHQVPQCGYCQAGQIMQAAALLRETREPSDAQIDEAMAGNLCRCGTYPRIRRAIRAAATASSGGSGA